MLESQNESNIPPSLSLSTKQATRNANPTRHSRTGSFLLRCSLLSLPPTATHRDVTRAKNRTQKFIDFAELWSKQVEYDELSGDFVIFTQIDSNASFYLVISIINSRHLCGKPPTLLHLLVVENLFLGPIFKLSNSFPKVNCSTEFQRLLLSCSPKLQ